MSRRRKLGWIVLDKDREPHRPVKPGFSPESGKTSPTKLYRSRGQADRIALKIGGTVKEVFYEG